MQLNTIKQFNYWQPSATGSLIPQQLSVLSARQKAKGDALAVIALSDMQGLTHEGGQYIPLGIEVFRYILPELEMDALIPPLSQCLLCIVGDMYASTTEFKMGLNGNIDPVLEEAMALAPGFLAIVLGNHDTLSPAMQAKLSHTPNVALLDGDTVETHGLVLGGISGIMGNPAKKPNRNDKTMLDKKCKQIVRQQPDILLLHEGPHLNEHQIGHSDITDALTNFPATTVISGHAHWQEPIAEFQNHRIINTDARIIVLQ